MVSISFEKCLTSLKMKNIDGVSSRYVSLSSPSRNLQIANNFIVEMLNQMAMAILLTLKILIVMRDFKSCTQENSK